MFHSEIGYSWDVNTGSQIGTPLLGHTGRVTYAGFRNDGTNIMSVGADKTLRFWSVPSNDEPTQTAMSKHNYPTTSNCSALSGNGNRILLLTNSSTLQSEFAVISCLWDMTTNESTKKLLEHNSYVICIALNEDGSRLIMGMQDGSALVRNVDTTSLIGHPLIGQTRAVDCVALNKDGSYAVVGSTDHSLQVWDVNMSAGLGTPLVGHSDRVRNVSISSSGKHVASGSDDLTVRIWDTETSSQIGQLKFKPEVALFPMTVFFSSDDDRIISCTRDGVARVWSIEDKQQICKPFEVKNFKIFGRDVLIPYETWLQEQLIYIRSRPRSNDVKQSHVCMRTLNNDVNRILDYVNSAVLKQYDCESKNGENCNTDDRERFGNYFNIAAATVSFQYVKLFQSNGETLVLANLPRDVQNYEIRGHSIRYTLKNGEILVCKIEE